MLKYIKKILLKGTENEIITNDILRPDNILIFEKEKKSYQEIEKIFKILPKKNTEEKMKLAEEQYMIWNKRRHIRDNTQEKEEATYRVELILKLIQYYKNEFNQKS